MTADQWVIGVGGGAELLLFVGAWVEVLLTAAFCVPYYRTGPVLQAMRLAAPSAPRGRRV